MLGTYIVAGTRRTEALIAEPINTMHPMTNAAAPISWLLRSSLAQLCRNRLRLQHKHQLPTTAQWKPQCQPTRNGSYTLIWQRDLIRKPFDFFCPFFPPINIPRSQSSLIYTSKRSRVNTSRNKLQFATVSPPGLQYTPCFPASKARMPQDKNVKIQISNSCNF